MMDFLDILILSIIRPDYTVGEGLLALGVLLFMAFMLGWMFGLSKGFMRLKKL